MEHRSHKAVDCLPRSSTTKGNKCAGKSAPNVASDELLEEKQMGGAVNCSDSELSTYLQDLEAGYWPTCCLDTDRCVQSKSNHIASKSYTYGKKTASFPSFRYFLTLQLSEEPLGEEKLILSQVDFLVRTLVVQDEAKGWKVKGQGSGAKWRGSSAKLSRDMSSWKIAPFSQDEDLTEYSWTWPKWGTMRNGVCSALSMSQPHTNDTESGYWLTPRALEVLESYETYLARMQASPNPKNNLKTPQNLSMQVGRPQSWPSPAARDWKDSPGMATVAVNPDGSVRNRTDQLARAVYHRGAKMKLESSGGVLTQPISKTWPTPRAFMHKDTTTDRGKGNLGEKVQGLLNPNWTEWLMGWPIEWTALRPLGTDRLASWLLQHSHILSCGLDIDDVLNE